MLSGTGNEGTAPHTIPLGGPSRFRQGDRRRQAMTLDEAVFDAQVQAVIDDWRHGYIDVAAMEAAFVELASAADL